MNRQYHAKVTVRWDNPTYPAQLWPISPPTRIIMVDILTDHWYNIQNRTRISGQISLSLYGLAWKWHCHYRHLSPLCNPPFLTTDFSIAVLLMHADVLICSDLKVNIVEKLYRDCHRFKINRISAQKYLAKCLKIQIEYGTLTINKCSNYSQRYRHRNPINILHPVFLYFCFLSTNKNSSLEHTKFQTTLIFFCRIWSNSLPMLRLVYSYTRLLNIG